MAVKFFRPASVAMLLAGLLASGSAAQEMEKLFASDAAAIDQFGVSVAIDAHRLVVGAHLSDGSDFNTGAAYVYRRARDGWAEEAKLAPDDEMINGRFGLTVDIDGRFIVVGTAEGQGVDEETGSVYVYHRGVDGWEQEAKLTPDDPQPLDRFGQTLALDGRRLAVGARNDDVTFFESGSVCIFERDAGSWPVQALITPSDPHEEQLFGNSVALDRNVLVVGAIWDDESVFQGGAAYVFRRDRNGAWVEEAKLAAEEPTSGSSFSESVAVCGDRIAIGEPGADDVINNSGAVHVFVRVDGAWERQARLLASDAQVDDWFGRSVALVGDRLAVGAINPELLPGWAGSVYLLEWQDEVWRERIKLLPFNTSLAADMGAAVDLGSGTIVAGSTLDDGAADDAGSAFLFDLER